MATIFFCFTYTSFSTALKYSRFFLLRRPVQDAFPPHRRERNAPGSVLAGSIGSTEGLAVAAPLYSFNCTLNENDFTLIDDQGRTYSNSDIWWDEGPSTTRCYGSALDRPDIMTMAPGQRIDIALRVY
jgi:hypothetical protein